MRHATCCLFDCDGCIRPLAGAKNLVAPPQELGEILSVIQRGHCLGIATGASRESVLQTHAHLELTHPMDFIAHSFCTAIWRPDGCERVISDEQKKLLELATPGLIEIQQAHSGMLADMETCITAFYETHSFPLARQSIKELLRQFPQLHLAANPVDGGASVFQQGWGKHVLIERLVQTGSTILIAAGDTEADIPLLEAAVFPILTRSSHDSAFNARMQAIVYRKGGYIAWEPHGYGLIAGLKAARAKSIIAF